MRRVTCSISVSLDGYIAGPDGTFAWSEPDQEVHDFATDEVRRLGVHLLGRRLYETMSPWDDAASDPSLGAPAMQAFASVWTALPKVVFSRTSAAVEGSYRLATRGLAEEIASWQAEPGDGDIGIGGAGLALEAARLDLLDEYRLRVYPVLVGGGTPLFPRDGHRVDLELLDTRVFSSGVVHLHHRVLHAPK